ncbi:crotonase/enoyl-CoA hydratase family protein [Ketobacter sp. MCCC 1A13808]|uniref:crotonase/enoyl-CoA hydratase family protein n=1 Tax=Ketobacter sp. MCCC 1A13808 TaxID=2602738 RepID=UPI000F0D3A24|nr:crotonase/enoyl-CoA hydratase family protein [Ketobacter sp. MCCC 1A13808]MVF11842.1 crotonase/enoyl-CoA hydratase family protein [Ketobacter sp. MCCC 1A13808]RLP55443.1 MAG: crotonase/enoyl-CoA hydratase family protein [Ketobacter sp.]
MSQSVSYREQGNVVVITLDDGRANAVSPAILTELNAALDQAERVGKVVVLIGREGKFSAGFDLNIMQQGGKAMAQLVADGAKLSLRLLNFPVPVVVACSGHALAMGALLLLSTDYRLGVDGNFKIGLNEVAIGMTMPYFGVELARGRLNNGYFARAVATAEIFTPETAMQAGYLDQLSTSETLLADALALAECYAKLDMTTYHATKIRVRQGMIAAVAEGVAKEFGAI